MKCEINHTNGIIDGPVLPPETIKQMENKLPTCLRLIQSCYKNKNTFSCV